MGGENGCPARPCQGRAGRQSCPGTVLSEGRSLLLLERLPVPDRGPDLRPFGRLLWLPRIHPVGAGSSARLERRKTAATLRFATLRSRRTRTGAPPCPFPLRPRPRPPASSSVAGDPRPRLSVPVRERPRDELCDALHFHGNRPAEARQGLCFARALDADQVPAFQEVAPAPAPPSPGRWDDGCSRRHGAPRLPSAAGGVNGEVLLNSRVNVREDKRMPMRANHAMQSDPEVKSPGHCRPHRGNECDSTS